MSCSISRMPIFCSSRIAQQQLVQLRGLARVEAGRRLVEAEQHRVGAHGARDLQPALVAIGQAAGRPVGLGREADAVEPVAGDLDRLALRPPVAGQTRTARRRCSPRRASACCAARRSGSPASTCRANSRMFWKVRATRAFCAMRKPSSCSSRKLPCGRVQREPADRRLVEAGQAIEHRGLAGAVRADDAR